MQLSVPRSDLEPGRPVAHPGTAIAVADQEPVPVRIGVLGCSSIARRSDFLNDLQQLFLPEAR